jgi:hypothetical protein
VTARHIYVDETKERGYVLVASFHASNDTELIKALRRFILPGQTRLHMTKESDARRRQILDSIIAAEFTATVYDAGRSYGANQLAARAAGLQALVEDAGQQQTLIVIEQDDSIIQWDRRFLYQAVRAVNQADRIRYEHDRAKSRPLLAVPDAIAWCWARGGETTNPDRCRLPKDLNTSKKQIRETRLAHRPEGCRVHFLGLLLQTPREYLLPRCCA